MKALTKDIVLEFCAQCNWAHYCWQFHRGLFQGKQLGKHLQHTATDHALGRLSKMTQEYGLLQMIKLHDPAVAGSSLTLGIDYMVKYGGWSPRTRSNLERLQQSLNAFIEPPGKTRREALRAARNKAICHNDLAALVDGGKLGAFRDEEVVRYFEQLQRFVNIAWREVAGEPFRFDKIGRTEGGALMAAIRSARIVRPAREPRRR